MGSQGRVPASCWAGAEPGSRTIQLPHFHFKVMKKKRKLQEARLGPGTYNIRGSLQETRPCSLRGICDTREPRFMAGRRDCFPGPGTYGPRGNPYTPLDERDKRSASTRGLLDSRTEKCGSGLGPGTYSLPSSIEEGLRRAAGRVPHRVSGDKTKPSGGRRHDWERKGTELGAGTAKSFLDELVSKENKKKGCFSTLPRNPGCPSERIFWATLSQCPRDPVSGSGVSPPRPRGVCLSRWSHRARLGVLGPCGSHFNQPPFWSSAKRFDRKSDRLFNGNENTVGVGRYDVTKGERCPQQLRYQSLYLHDAQRYLSNPKQDAYLL
ncbi:Lymphocyte expansion molecule [Aix galericulata]|nr:Lymphocyte expansion molecule [Aix galericulata]